MVLRCSYCINKKLLLIQSYEAALNMFHHALNRLKVFPFCHHIVVLSAEMSTAVPNHRRTKPGGKAKFNFKKCST